LGGQRAPSSIQAVTFDAASTLLERAWYEREEVIYANMFGPLEPSIAPLSVELFQDIFGQSDVDPRWLHTGVMVAPPTAERASWLYVSSGLSNAWNSETPQAMSGLGREFVLETEERAEWAILRLQHVAAFELLLAAGRYPNQVSLQQFDRLPLRGPIAFVGESPITHLLVVPSPTIPRFSLESGEVELLSVVGITDDEAGYARFRGGDALLLELQRATTYPVTDPSRSSSISHPVG
jgi:hypothetical protein